MASRTVFIVLAAVGIAAASGAAWWLQSRPRVPQEMGGTPARAVAPGQAASARVAGVEVARVVAVRLQDDAQAVGTLRSRQSVVLRPEVAGRIQRLGFVDGARVRRGQLLVQLDNALQRAELSQAQAQLSIAQANFRRNQELVAKDFVAQRVLDESAANLQVAQAQVALAQARLGRMALVAPFDGTLGIRLVNVGDYVKDGADLVNLEDTGTLLVDFRLPERFQGKLQRGQPVELQFDALPGQNVGARVEAIDPLLDANGRSVAVRAVLANTANAPLRPGMFARVRVVFAVNDKALVVPEEAIVPQGGKQYVVKVVAAPASAASASGVSKRQEVTLGSRSEGRVEVTQGVGLGDTVVVAGQQRLQADGSPVKIVTLGAPAGPASAAASAPAR